MAGFSNGDGNVSCVLTNCDKNGSCIYACSYSDPFLSPPPPLLPPPAGESRLAPYLIATVCILGISFLLLTTCTIILRYRFSHRRRVSVTRVGDSATTDDDDLAGAGGVDHPIWHIATVGLQQSIIDSITVFKYKKLDGFLTEEGSDCSVCLTAFDDGDELRLLPKCSHAFHIPCIDTWLRSHKNCPLCRAPVVSESFEAGVLRQPSLSNLDRREETQMENLEYGNDLERESGSSSDHQLRRRSDDFVELPIEGTKIAEILKKNRELRILSDLGENHRFRGEEDEDGAEPIRRSISFNGLAALAICSVVGNVSSVSNEGCSSNCNAHLFVQEKKIDIEKVAKRGTSMSGLLSKSSSIGRSLQKTPVSMKRSISSSGKLFSFRRTRSQASILPL